MSDLIEREAVIYILDDMVKDYIKENDFDKAQGVAWVKVQKLPSVSMEKTGRWIYKEIRGEKVPCCSKCGLDNGSYYEYEFCPNCE